MEFNQVLGSEISEYFFEDGECCYEAEIESAIHDAIRKVCGKNVKIRKSKLSGGITDGIVKLYNNGEYIGFIINESKRDQTNRLETGMAQAMFYAGSFLYDVSFDKEINSEKFIGVFITTAYEFIFVPKKELPIESFKPFWDLYNYMCPSKAAKETDYKFIGFKYNHFYKLDESFRLDNLIKDIYEQNY